MMDFIHPPIPITTIKYILYWNSKNSVSLFYFKKKNKTLKISSVWYIKYLQILTYLKW